MFCPMLRKMFPFECLENVCDTDCAIYLEWILLLFFELCQGIRSFCGVWIVNSAVIFQMWSDKGFIQAKVFVFSWSCVEVSFNETQGYVGFFGDTGGMVDPREILERYFSRYVVTSVTCSLTKFLNIDAPCNECI